MAGGSGNRKGGGGGAIAFDIIGITNMTIITTVTDNDFFISYPPFVTDVSEQIFAGETSLCS
jgi:hypothetical protein